MSLRYWVVFDNTLSFSPDKIHSLPPTGHSIVLDVIFGSGTCITGDDNMADPVEKPVTP